MGFWTGLESGIEKAVRTAFTAGSRKRVEAVEIASALRRELDQESFTISAGRTMAPNVFTVQFSDEDFPRAQEWGTQLAEELCDVIIRHARSQAYTLQGAVRVSFIRNPDLEAGEFHILSSSERTEPGAASAGSSAGAASASVRAPEPPPAPRQEPRPAPFDAAPSPAHEPHQAVEYVPVIEVSGERFSLNAPAVSVGRSTEADITVEDTGVSRKHLEIRRQGQHYVAVDLGSTNGSYVDGERVQGRAELVNGSVITMGRTRLVFRLLIPKEGR
ncbi:DUF3662 and FHA domain-containing protein [Kocuria atrinae]|uniref:FhaA domain-containing protein n=1 Tax=Kocuria atrinae TaxID=592377 RepID=UPI000309FC4D|nr:DUF3662 and FHA domain-containing protein [Kocuria atrinae]